MDKFKRILLRMVFILCISVVCFSAKALGGYDSYEEYDGDSWSMSADGVLTIESNQGWANCIRHGYKPEVKKLVIGKDVTYFRMYRLPDDLQSPDYFDAFKVAEYDKNGRPNYECAVINDLFPRKIIVEDGNPAFKVVNGLLINTTTNQLVLSEMGVADVIIPEGVKTITRNAFHMRKLTSVQFPSSLEVIGEDAFAKCVNLTEIKLPDSLFELRSGAFIVCEKLRKVQLPSKLQVLGAYVFSGCPITYIEIPKTIEEIGAYAFSDCDMLYQVILRAGLKRINNRAFSDCKQLMRIEFPDGLESIGEYAFYNCHSLKRVILPDLLEQIGNEAFSDCNLSVLRIPANLTFPVYDRDKEEYIANPHTKEDKTFGLSSAETVILSGSDYDFGYPAISHAHNVYFLGKPPEDVGQILDENSVESIFCSDEFEFEWTRSTVASWVRQRLTILPADQMKQITEQELNATPLPTDVPRPTPRPTETPWPTPMPRPTASPAVTAKPEQQGTDPLVFAFAGILALLIAGIVVVAVKSGKPKKRAQKRK